MARAVKWTFVSKRTKTERKQQRKNVRLWDAGITKRTQARYFNALSKLLPVLTGIFTALDLDDKVSNWIETAWEDGEALHLVSDALCGLHHYEGWTKGMIPMSWKLFQIWKKLEAPDRAPPLTADILYAWGNYAIEHNQVLLGALLCLGFFALLRTGEILALRPIDVLVGDTKAILSLQHTKSGQRDNVGEMVMVDDFLTVELLRTAMSLHKRSMSDKVPLWPYSAEAFRRHFRKYCDKFDLSQHKFRPYSLRRGGATHLFQCSGSMELALLKGRWTSSRVARIYIYIGWSKPSAKLDFFPENKSNVRKVVLLKAVNLPMAGRAGGAAEGPSFKASFKEISGRSQQNC